MEYAILPHGPNARQHDTDWMTADEASRYLKAKPRSLLLWVRQGRVKAYALSGTKRRIWRFRREDLDTALLSHPVLESRPPNVLANEGRGNASA